MTEFPDLLSTAARNHGDLIALIDPGRTLTWSELDAAANHLAVQLESQSVRPGTRVAIVENNRIELPILLLALIRLGAVATLLSPRFSSTAHPKQVTTAGCQFQAVLSPLSESRHLPETSPIVVPPLVDLLKLGAKQDSSSDAHINANQPATIIFTSGSSTEPKAVLHSLGNHYYSALGSNQNLPVAPTDRWLLSLPLYHVGGLGILFRCLLEGAAIVLRDQALDLADQIIRDQVTHLSLVPTQLGRLLARTEFDHAGTSLKAVLLGGGPAPDVLVNQAQRQGLPVYPTYGLTEMASQVATASPEAPKILSILDHRELKITDDGDILVRGDTLFLGYIGREGVDRPLDAGGWFHTGDIGHLDENGGLIVTGRKDNMFISGGENISPEQIERALGEIDGVEEALIVPVEDDEFGRRPVAFLRCHESISLSECESGVSEEEKFLCDFASLSTKLEKTLPRFMLPVAFYPWPQGYQPVGLKADREFFKELAAKLHRARS